MSQLSASKSSVGTSSSPYMFSSDMYVILAFIGLITIVIGGTVVAESSIPLMRGNFVNNIGAVILTIMALGVVYYYRGKSVTLLGRTINAGYFAYVLIIIILVFLFSG